mgnify:CR=1 FL=1
MNGRFLDSIIRVVIINYPYLIISYSFQVSNIVQLFVVLDLADLVPQRSTKILVPPSMVVLAVRLEFSIRESRNGWQIEMDQLEVCLGV